MKLIQIIIASFIPCLFQLGQCDELQLELVQVLFRHGERTPLAKEFYPNDPHDHAIYDEWGVGQLTNVGKMREYILGKMLRKRYSNFLGDLYYPQDVYARSSDIDRTKMSLQLVLASLYPPVKSQVWNPEVSWMPIPTHYMPEEVDNLFRSHYSPKYEAALEKVKQTTEVKEKVAVFCDVFAHLSTKAGVKIVNTTQVYEIYHLLMAQRSMKLAHPEWVTDDVVASMREITALDYDIRSYNTELKRLNGGTLVRRFVENLNISQAVKPVRKIYLYSGHEVNVAAFTRSHGFKEPSLPTFGSAVILEKLKNKKTGKIYVKLFVWSGVSEELIQLKLNNSSDPCPIDVYLKLIQDVIPSDEEMNAMLTTTKSMENLYVDKVCTN